MDITPFKMRFYEEVFALWQQCEGVGITESDSRDNVQAYLRRNPGLSFVALSSGRIVGAILAGHDGRRGYLNHLGGAPGLQKKRRGKTPCRPQHLSASPCRHKKMPSFYF